MERSRKYRYIKNYMLNKNYYSKFLVECLMINDYLYYYNLIIHTKKIFFRKFTNYHINYT